MKMNWPGLMDDYLSESATKDKCSHDLDWAFHLQTCLTNTSGRKNV